MSAENLTPAQTGARDRTQVSPSERTEPRVGKADKPGATDAKDTPPEVGKKAEKGAKDDAIPQDNLQRAIQEHMEQAKKGQESNISS